MENNFIRKMVSVLLVLFVMITNVPAKQIHAEEGVLTTDKTEYELGEAIMVTANDGSWVGLYKKGESYDPDNGGVTSFFWYYVDDETHDPGTAYNILSQKSNGRTDFTAGEYKVVLFGDSGYGNPLETVEITLTQPESPITEPALSLDLSNAVDTERRAFRYGEPINVIAASPNASAWVALVKRHDNVDNYNKWYYVSDHQNEAFNILEGSNGVASGITANDIIDPSNEQAPGRYNVVLFTDGGYDVEKIVSIWILKVYDVKEWELSEDKKSATVTFESTDDQSIKELTTEDVTSRVVTEPTCTAPGKIEYTVKVNVNGAFQTLTKEDEFETKIEEDIPALGHDWNEPTFEWAEDYSSAKATFVCKNDEEHKEVVDATITSKEESGKTVYIATVTFNEKEYTDTKEVEAAALLETDKTEYELGDDILVSASGYESFTKPWIGVYVHGQVPGSEGVESVLWYDLNSENDTDHNIKDGITRTGEYDIYLFSTYEFAIEAKVEIKVTGEDPNTLVTDKDVYTAGDPIMVTATSDITDAWVALFTETGSIHESSITWYYINGSYGGKTWVNGETYDVFADGINNSAASTSELAPGKYRVDILYENENKVYVQVLSKTITLEAAGPVVEDAIWVDKTTEDGSIPKYKYGEPVLVSATSPNPKAFIRLSDYYEDDPHSFNEGGYVNIKLSDIEESIDIIKAAIDAGVAPEAGKQYRIYLVSPDEDPTHWVKQAKCELVVTYYDDDEHLDWTLSEDKTSAQITFHRNDPVTEDVTRTTTNVTKATVAATCTEAGKDSYTAVYAFGEDDALVTVNDKVSFTHVFEEEIPALGHDWGEWEVIKEATETEDGLERRVCKHDPTHVEERIIPKTGHTHTFEHVAAKPATCEEDGNIEYWHCEECGRYFTDEAGEHEVNAEDVVIKALEHDWKFVSFTWADNLLSATATFVCNRDASHKYEMDAKVVKETVGGKTTYTAMVVGPDGKDYQEVKNEYSNFVETDKAIYEAGEPVYVTAYSDKPEAWVSFLSVDGSVHESSFWWYWVDGTEAGKTWKNGETYNIFEGICNNKNGVSSPDQIPSGMYRISIIYVNNGINTEVASKQIEITGKHVEGALSTDKDVYEVGEPIFVSTTTGVWVGLYRKGEAFNPQAGGSPSIFWYYTSEEGNPVNILATRDENNRSADYGVGEFTVSLFSTSNYDSLDSKDITIVPSTISPEDIKLTLEKNEFDLNEPIIYSINRFEPGYHVGLYRPTDNYENKSVLPIAVNTYKTDKVDLLEGERNRKSEYYEGGDFVVVLLDGDNNALDVVPIVIHTPAGDLKTDKSSYQIGEPIIATTSYYQEDGMIGIYRDGETPSASLQPFYSVKLVEGQSEYDLAQGTKGRTLNYETVKDNTAFAVYLYREIDYAPVAIAEIEITDKIVSDRTTPATCYDDEIRYVVYEHNGEKYFIISPALGHEWKLDGFTWAEDYSSAEAKFVCTRDEAHTRVKQASVKVEKTAEKATYTAKVYGPDGVTYTEVKEVDLAPVKAPELVMIYNSANGGDLRFMPVEGAEEYIIMRKENGVWSEIRTLKDSAFEKLSNGAYQYIDETVKDSYGKGYIYSVAVKGNDDSLVYDSYGLALYRLDKPVITSVQKVSDTQVKVTWLDQKVHGYELQYSVDGGKKWNELEETTELALTVDLETNADYIFRLRAQKTNASRGKTWSQYSDWAKIGTLAKPQLIAIYNSADGVGVHFRPVETATSYILMKKENGVWSEVREFKAEELKEEKGNLIIMDESVKDNYGKGYIYSVEASNGKDRSGYNTKGLAIYRLAAPQISSVAVNGSSVTLVWNKVDAHGYEVQYSSDNGKTWEKAEEVTGTETTLELEAGKQYVFRVRCEKTNAQRGTTWSQYSPWRSATTR